MALSNYLAEIWGISIVVVSLAFLIKERHLKRLFASIETEDNLFMWGLVNFVIGISMVLTHNIWVKDWQIVITIFGWLSILKGLFLLFSPDFMKRFAKKIEGSPLLPFALLISIFIGLALTYLGFTS